MSGVVAEADSSVPVLGALVVLVDGAGREVRTSFTDLAGWFRLVAPGAGDYTLRVDRIGYASTRTGVLRLEPGAERLQRIDVAVAPVSLEGIHVAAGQRCVVRPGAEAVQTAKAWEQAKAALTATSATRRQRLLRFDYETYSRRLDARTLQITGEERAHRSGSFSSPFFSRDAEDLLTHGFIRPVEGGRYFDFFAPSADVLLSDAFLDTHCFRLVSGRGPNEGLIGLEFEPVARRMVTDVRGTLWLEPRSAKLRHAEIRYVAHDPRTPATGASARVEFESLPSGAWIVRRWFIRMPELRVQRFRRLGPGFGQPSVIAYREDGGEVTHIRAIARDTASPGLRLPPEKGRPSGRSRGAAFPKLSRNHPPPGRDAPEGGARPRLSPGLPPAPS